ncbi:MAG: hypothetical protein NC419_02245 [Muribaculaceae bacterium]|nr:hypothetical protein [Muribaculaceae bacterium]
MSRNNSFISSFKHFFSNGNTKFVLKLFLFFMMVITYFYLMMPQYEGIYCASLQDKVKRLESLEGPKIVLLGNSNLTFGIESELIESAFGMPVVNMGLHGGLGNRFHEDMARYHVEEGDIYILCHTSFADDGSIGDATLVWSAIENHPKLWKLLRLSDARDMLEAFPKYLKKCVELYNTGQGNQDFGGMYARSAFNEYGDVALERNENLYIFKEPVNPPPINETTVQRINELNAWLEERGAVLLIATYPIGSGELTAEAEEFDAFQKELEEQLDPVVISRYTDYMYDYTCFYDTSLHLNSETARIRTEQLIEDIKNWQELQIE